MVTPIASKHGGALPKIASRRAVSITSFWTAAMVTFVGEYLWRNRLRRSRTAGSPSTFASAGSDKNMGAALPLSQVPGRP